VKQVGSFSWCGRVNREVRRTISKKAKKAAGKIFQDRMAHVWGGVGGDPGGGQKCWVWNRKSLGGASKVDPIKFLHSQLSQRKTGTF